MHNWFIIFILFARHDDCSQQLPAILFASLSSDFPFSPGLLLFFWPYPTWPHPPRGTWFSLRPRHPRGWFLSSFLKCVSTWAPNLRVSEAWFKFAAAWFSLWLDKINKFLLLCTDWVFLFIVPRCAINCVFLWHGFEFASPAFRFFAANYFPWFWLQSVGWLTGNGKEMQNTRR